GGGGAGRGAARGGRGGGAGRRLARDPVGPGRAMTGGRRALAVASATVGTALLAGAFVLMIRAEASTWAMLAWGAVALVAVAAFLTRFRAERVQEALRLAGLVALGQT